MASLNSSTPPTRRRKPAPVGGDIPRKPSSAIEDLPLDAIRPYGRNARRHDARQVELIARSIEAFGFVNPVLVDKSNVLVAGHGRLEAAKRLGLTVVPTLRIEHLTEAQVRAYRIADNRIAELSDWNDEVLRLEIVDLANLDLAGALDFDITLTGFDTPAIDLIIAGNRDAVTSEPEEVEAPDPSRPAVTRRGDLWILGEHRLFCGDALASPGYEALLDGGVARMVFTDPPYNVPVNGHVRSGNAGLHREFAMASGEMSDREFRQFLSAMFARLATVLADGGVAMVCMDWRHIEELIAAGKAGGFELINLCVWNKTNGGMGSLYRSKHELVCIFRKPGAPHINNVELGRHGRNRTNVWDYAGVNSFGGGRAADLADHPTVKPTALVADAILDVSGRGDIVLDTFGGSGATLLAAEKTGRRARLIELDPLYVDVAIRRWQAMTGRQAVHASTGETWAACTARPVTGEGVEVRDVEA